MKGWQAAGTDKCDLICALSGLNFGNQDKSVPQQFVTSLSGLSRLPPNQGQQEQKAVSLESLAPGKASSWFSLESTISRLKTRAN